MNDTNHINTAIKSFVRESLGCACPDGVFEKITVTEHSDIFISENTVYEIGGRLLVAVLVPVVWQDMTARLAQLVEAGKQYRDQHGYNRFRLVIVTEDRNAPTCLLSAFDCLPNIDEKTHLHVIKPEALPSRIGLGC